VLDPTLRLLSLGAGVQSTTLALLAVEGRLPRLDGAIFADTGWEPAGVYAHLDRISVVLAEAGIPLHRVSGGDLRRDAVDPSRRFASIPYFVKNPPGPCRRCDATGRLPAPDTVAPNTVIPDAVALDTLASDAAVSAVGDRQYPRCRGTGRSDGLGMGRRQCTAQYKVSPINRKVRELLGAPAPEYRRVPGGRVAECWIGFSVDEIGRVWDKHRVRYEATRYPLLELGMSRQDCQRFLRRRGWADTPKSACIGCPFHTDQQWRQLRDERPAEWADAVAFDRLIRRGGARGEPLRGEAFLHRSRVPLDLAPLDQPPRPHRCGRVESGLEREEAGGSCSPYGCRSEQRAA
jgi:hypothetical protein